MTNARDDALFFGILALIIAGLPALSAVQLQLSSLFAIPYGHPLDIAATLLLHACASVIPVVMVVRVPILPIRIAVVLLALFFFASNTAALLGLPSVYTPLFGSEDFRYFQF